MKKILALFLLTSVAQFTAAADIVGNARAAKVDMCIGCHGLPGYKATFPEVFPVPMLGGQSAKYIENALQAYKKGDRKHPTMAGIAGSMSEQDMANAAAYYALQTVPAAGAGAAGGKVESGKALAAKLACASCHGADYGKPIDPSYPKLAGQHRAYLAHALTTYKRGNGPAGRNNAIMAGMAAQLTDQNIQDIAAYLESLPATLVVKR
jgi:cytochrome c553